MEYNEIESLEYFTNEILPSVYDDSLSYSELLEKVISYLNTTITNVDELKNFIDDFIEKFDKKLNPLVFELLQEMYNNGELKIIIDEFLNNKSSEIDDTLEEFKTQMTQQITEQNANIAEIDTFMNNIKGISYASLDDTTVELGDFLALIKNKWAELPMGASILRVVAGRHGGGGIAYKSSHVSGTVLILRNGMAPLVVQNSSNTWRTYNWGV